MCVCVCVCDVCIYVCTCCHHLTYTFPPVPLEFLTLYVDCPWMIVYNDVRTGIVILAMAVYWIVFIGEHTEVRSQGLDHFALRMST